MRVQLDRCYIYKGKFYGPGMVDVPAGLVDNLGLGLIWKPDPPQAAKGKPTPVIDLTDGEEETVTVTLINNLVQPIANPERTDPLGIRLPEETPYLGILQAAGVTTVHDALSHPDLTQIKNIGPGRAFKIIEFLEA